MAKQRCRVCGCTDARACPGGCSWVELDLCSACWGEHESVDLVDAVAAALMEDCQWTAIEAGLVDGLAEDDEVPPLELDISTGGGW